MGLIHLYKQQQPYLSCDPNLDCVSFNQKIGFNFCNLIGFGIFFFIKFIHDAGSSHEISPQAHPPIFNQMCHNCVFLTTAMIRLLSKLYCQFIELSNLQTVFTYLVVTKHKDYLNLFILIHVWIAIKKIVIAINSPIMFVYFVTWILIKYVSNVYLLCYFDINSVYKMLLISFISSHQFKPLILSTTKIPVSSGASSRGWCHQTTCYYQLLW